MGRVDAEGQRVVGQEHHRTMLPTEMMCLLLLNAGAAISWASVASSATNGGEMKKIVIIGNGKMTIECLKIIKAYKNAHILLVIADPKDITLMFLKQYCKREGLDLELSNNVNSLDIVEKIKKTKPDIIFNINSFQIIRKKLIGIPSDGIINFHNGPLPTYRGVNVCSWAILNGEKTYGVSWHYVEEGIDSGDIVAQKFFNLSGDETACSLILKCIDEGVLLFKEFFSLLLEEKVTAVSQDSSRSSHYKKRDIPYGGILNYEWNFDKFDSFIRGLDFYPIPNDFVYPKSYVKSRAFYVRKIVKSSKDVSETRKCGQIVDINETGIDVEIGDTVIKIIEVLNDNLKPIKIIDFAESYSFEVGDQMQH